jgi:hypothetical protein
MSPPWKSTFSSDTLKHPAKAVEKASGWTPFVARQKREAVEKGAAFHDEKQVEADF